MRMANQAKPYALCIAAIVGKERIVMKKLIVILFTLLFAGSYMMTASASTTNAEDTIMVRKSDLPPQVLKDLEDRQALALMSQRIETYGKWVGIGKEVGSAVNDSLSAITTQADNFAKTGVGKFTMVIVAYKVLGKDLVGMTIGIPLLVVWISIFIYFWRRLYVPHKILDRIEGKTKFYKVIEPGMHGDDRQIATAILFIGFLIAMVWTLSGVIF